MGYSYTSDGRLCCDSCGEPGGVRRERCPAGWCQPVATCRGASCREELKRYRRETCAKSCRKASAEFKASEDRKAALQASGLSVRCAALSAGGSLVHVLFEFQGGRREGRFMLADTYHAIPLMEPATVDDYRKHGEVLPAPAEFEGGRRVTKEVPTEEFIAALERAAKTRATG